MTKKNREPHPAKRPPGRPHNCRQPVIDKVIDALNVSAGWEDAALYAGISERALFNYLERGRLAMSDAGFDVDDAPPGDDDWQDLVEEDERPFVQLLQRSMHARGRGNISLLAIAHKCAKGGPVYEDRIEEDGSTTRVQVGFIQPDGRVAMKLLAVRNPKDYAEKRQVELSGDGKPVLGVQVYLPELEGEDGGETSEGGEV